MLKKLITSTMNKTYIFLIIIAFAGAVVAAILPMKDYSKKEMAVEQLQAELNLKSRFYSTDLIADLLINKDPSLMLIDVRDKVAFDKFHLPDAVSIPLDKLMDSSSLEMLGMDFKKKVFYSNGTSDASTAWIVARRNNFENVFIMDGGLNRWYETIINPQKPSDEANESELELYSFRLAASQYFVKGNSGRDKTENANSVKAPKSVKVIKRKNTPSGGC